MCVAKFEHHGVRLPGRHAPGLLFGITRPAPTGERAVPAHLPGQAPVRQTLAHRAAAVAMLLVGLHFLAGFVHPQLHSRHLRQGRRRHHQRAQAPVNAPLPGGAHQQPGTHRQQQHQRQPAAARLRQHRPRHAQRHGAGQQQPLPQHPAPPLRHQQQAAHHGQQHAQVAVLDGIGEAIGARQAHAVGLVEPHEPAAHSPHRNAHPQP